MAAAGLSALDVLMFRLNCRTRPCPALRAAVTPDAPRRPLGTLALAAAALGLAGLLASGLGLALARMGWFKERDPRGFLLGREQDRTGRVLRLEREGGVTVLTLDEYPAVGSYTFREPDPRLDGLKPGDRVTVRGRYTDASLSAPRLGGCRLLLGPADFDAPGEGTPAEFWQRNGRWWWPVPAPRPR